MGKEKLKIEKLEGTIAYVTGIEIEQINTNDFIIFKVSSNDDLQVINNIIGQLKAKGVKKNFIILPKTIEYCVFRKGDK